MLQVPKLFNILTCYSLIKVSAGFGIWIPKEDYDFVKYQRADTPPKFVKNIASKIFTDEVLKESTVTGKASNAYVHQEGEKNKTALDPVKMKAVAGKCNLLCNLL